MTRWKNTNSTSCAKILARLFIIYLFANLLLFLLSYFFFFILFCLYALRLSKITHYFLALEILLFLCMFVFVNNTGFEEKITLMCTFLIWYEELTNRFTHFFITDCICLSIYTLQAQTISGHNFFVWYRLKTYSLLQNQTTNIQVYKVLYT